jgi:hypothetical protein
MAKNPEDRFPTMAQFCAELEACLADLQSGHTTQVAAVAAPRRRPAPRRGVNPWPFVIALLVLIAIGAVVAYLIVRQHDNNSAGGPSGGSSGGTPHLTGVTAWDPYGDRVEHSDKAYLATDASPSTAWETEHYRDPPSLGKAGVGLVLDAGSSTKLHQLGFVSSTPGFVAEIRAGDSKDGPFPDVVAGPQTVPASGQVQYTINESSPHQYYVIWITSLGPSYDTAKINDVKAT